MATTSIWPIKGGAGAIARLEAYIENPEKNMYAAISGSAANATSRTERQQGNSRIYIGRTER